MYMYMYIKTFGQKRKKMETRIQTMRIYSQDIGMGFDIEKCTMLVIKSDKRHTTEGIELWNQIVIKTLGEKEAYKYLRVLEADTIKQQEMKKIFKNEYLRRARKLLETKLYCRNFVKKDKYLGCTPRKILGIIL